MGLKRDRQTINDEWGDYPLEARIYLVAKCAQRRLTRMSGRKKMAFALGVLAVGIWAIWAGIQIGIPSWPLALVVGIILGAILLYIALFK